MPEISYYTIKGKRESSELPVDCPIPPDPDEGQILVSTIDGIEWQDMIDFQGSVIILCRATTNIIKGQAVYILDAPTNIPGVSPASCIVSDSSRVIGIATSNISQNSNGYILRTGTLTNVDTRTSNTSINPFGETWLEGDLLFLATAGGMTKVRPTSGRTVKVGYNLQNSHQFGSILAYPMENPIWSTCASGENNVLRVGDNAGVNKVSIRKYDNAEVASVDSLGNLMITGTLNEKVVGDATHLMGIEINDDGIGDGKILIYDDDGDGSLVYVDMPNVGDAESIRGVNVDDADIGSGKVLMYVSDGGGKIIYGEAPASEDTNRIKGVEVNDTDKSNNKILVYKASPEEFIFESITGAGMNIDGGNASSTYLPEQIIDAGGA